MKKRFLLIILTAMIAGSIACRTTIPSANPTTAPAKAGTTAQPSQATPKDSPTQPTDLTVQPVKPGSDEPTIVTGEIPYTSPFFLASTAEPYVMLEDEAGFVSRDDEFQFPLPSQVIGAVDKSEPGKLTFTLELPSVPQATYVDVDNNGQKDIGVQVFQVAYWSNTWGDPFLERRDGTGWSTAYTSATTDPERENEINGGTLMIWAPNDQQSFPTDFGADNKLFTEDDPTGKVPAGYSLVDLSQHPFRIYKESQPHLVLVEGATQVNDYASQGYGEAFKAMFDKVSVEYPFTDLKKIDWQALRDRFVPQADKVQNDQDFYSFLRDFILQIPDSHVGVTLNQRVFFNTYGGGFGLVVAELSDGTVIASKVLPGKAAANAGIQPGAAILTWNGKPVGEAISAVVPGFAPYSAAHTLRAGKVQFLTRTAPDTQVAVTYRNPGGQSEQSANLTAEPEYDSLFASMASTHEDSIALTVDGRVLDSGLGYIRITSFQDDYNLLARVWDRYIQNMNDNKVPGLIIDVRDNGGGSMGLALDFAAYFFNKEFDLYQSYYYNNNSGKFEATKHPTRIRPAPQYYDKPVAVLVSTNCVSACEGFAYAMQQQGRAIIVGHTPSAGGFGEVGQGQYEMPGKLSMQFPTGRSETSDGKIVIEGVGVVPDITVPVTAESALGQVDAVLQAAIDALLKK